MWRCCLSTSSHAEFLLEKSLTRPIGILFSTRLPSDFRTVRKNSTQEPISGTSPKPSAESRACQLPNLLLGYGLGGFRPSACCFRSYALEASSLQSASACQRKTQDALSKTQAILNLAFRASIRSQRELPVDRLCGCQRKALGLKDQVHGKRPTIAAAHRVIPGRVGGDLDGQVRILELYFQRFTF
jgi:hypothetical protein